MSIQTLDQNKIPEHVAIIMDGNGRWAKQKGKLRVFGHKNGVKAVRETVEAAAEAGVKYLTLYAFSTENWNRPQKEINALMELLVSSIAKETPTLNKNNIRLETIGNIASLPSKCQKELNTAKVATSENKHMTLILALSYSSKWEITDAMKKISVKVKEGILSPEDINEEVIQNHLNTANYPNPELMIRTSGEHRISNFLLWQLAYAEFYFTEVLWPDFNKKHFLDALLDYQNRERRFGKTSEQISS